jgi:hypothetical protein
MPSLTVKWLGLRTLTVKEEAVLHFKRHFNVYYFRKKPGENSSDQSLTLTCSLRCDNNYNKKTLRIQHSKTNSSSLNLKWILGSLFRDGYIFCLLNDDDFNEKKAYKFAVVKGWAATVTRSEPRNFRVRISKPDQLTVTFSKVTVRSSDCVDMRSSPYFCIIILCAPLGSQLSRFEKFQSYTFQFRIRKS